MTSTHAGDRYRRRANRTLGKETKMSSGIEAPVAIPDLTDPRTFADAVPHAAFAEIRKLPGLYWQPTDVGVANGGFWAVTRFADIQAIEKDTESFTSTRGGVYPGTNREPGKATTSDNLMLTDPPRHSRLRRAAAKGFSPRVVANFDSWVREIVREVVDTIEGKDEFDWVQEVAMTVPARVLARILGTPAQDTPRLVDWTIQVFATAGRTDLQPGESVEQRMWAVMSELAVYAEQLQEVKRKNPADDMFTELTGCVDRGEITQNEFRMWMAVLMMAGFETTHTAIGQ